MLERKFLIDLVLELNYTFKQSQKTVHYAIAYIDHMLAQSDLFASAFQDKMCFKKDFRAPTLRMHRNLLACTCFLLASKFYEIDDNLVLSTDIQKKFRQLKLNYDEFKRAEI